MQNCLPVFSKSKVVLAKEYDRSIVLRLDEHMQCSNLYKQCKFINNFKNYGVPISNQFS